MSKQDDSTRFLLFHITASVVALGSLLGIWWMEFRDGPRQVCDLGCASTSASNQPFSEIDLEAYVVPDGGSKIDVSYDRIDTFFRNGDKHIDTFFRNGDEIEAEITGCCLSGVRVNGKKLKMESKAGHAVQEWLAGEKLP